MKADGRRRPRKSRRRWTAAGVLALATLAARVVPYSAGPSGLVATAQAQSARSNRVGQQQQPLLSQEEVQAGLNTRLQRMRDRRAPHRTRRMEEQGRLRGSGRAPWAGRPSPPRVPPTLGDPEAFE